MIIQKYVSGKLTPAAKVDYIEMGDGPLVYFSSDAIPNYIPEDARKRLTETFHVWRDEVLVLGQIIDETLTVLSISMGGRPVDSLEMEYLCENMNIPLAQTIYSGPFNEPLLQLVDTALIRQENSNILWRRE